MDKRRLSVGLSQPEMDQLYELAHRLDTSVSMLGQLAIRHLLVQARSGATPMLRPLQPDPDLSNLDRARRGKLASMAAWRGEATETIDAHQTALNLIDAKAILDGLPTQ